MDDAVRKSQNSVGVEMPAPADKARATPSPPVEEEDGIGGAGRESEVVDGYEGAAVAKDLTPMAPGLEAKLTEYRRLVDDRARSGLEHTDASGADTEAIAERSALLAERQPIVRMKRLIVANPDATEKAIEDQSVRIMESSVASQKRAAESRKTVEQLKEQEAQIEALRGELEAADLPPDLEKEFQAADILADFTSKVEYLLTFEPGQNGLMETAARNSKELKRRNARRGPRAKEVNSVELGRSLIVHDVSETVNQLHGLIEDADKLGAKKQVREMNDAMKDYSEMIRVNYEPYFDHVLGEGKHNLEELLTF